MRKFIILLYFLFSTQSAYSASLCEQLFTNTILQISHNIKDRFQSHSLKKFVRGNSSPKIQLQVLKSLRIPHVYDIPILKEILRMNPSDEKVQIELMQLIDYFFALEFKNLSRKNKKDMLDILNRLSEMKFSVNISNALISTVNSFLESIDSKDKKLSKEEREILFNIVKRSLDQLPWEEENVYFNIWISIKSFLELTLSHRSNFSESRVYFLVMTNNIRDILERLLEIPPLNDREKEFHRHIQQDFLPQINQ